MKKLEVGWERKRTDHDHGRGLDMGWIRVCGVIPRVVFFLNIVQNEEEMVDG